MRKLLLAAALGVAATFALALTRCTVNGSAREILSSGAHTRSRTAYPFSIGGLTARPFTAIELMPFASGVAR